MPRPSPALILSLALLTLSPAAALAAAAAAQPPAAAPATPAAPGRLTLKTDRAVIFKDGHALIVKTATATADASGRVFTNDVPESAVLGSLWATSEKTPVRSMRAEWVESTRADTKRTSCITTLELLRANVGREVTL